MLTKVEFEFLEGVEEELVEHSRTDGSVHESEGLEIVPSIWGDPGVLGLVALSSDKACWIGGAESADGPSVGEEGIVYLEWN